MWGQCGNVLVMYGQCFIRMCNIFEIDELFDDFKVVAEHITDNDGRIDFVVGITDQYDGDPRAIIIELKLDSDIQNDLTDYYYSISHVKEKNKVGIVLSLRDVSEVIGGTKFVHIPLIAFLKAFTSDTKKLSSHHRDISFLNEVEYFTSDLENSFYGANTNTYISLLLNNGDVLRKIDAVYELALSDQNRKQFVKDKIDILKNISLIRRYTIDNIVNYLDFVADKNARTAHHNRKAAMFYLKGKVNSLFPDLVRLGIDYSFVKDFDPVMEIFVDVNFAQLKKITEDDVTYSKLTSSLASLGRLSSWFTPRKKPAKDWNRFFTRTISVIADISQFDQLVIDIVAQILLPVEHVIEGWLATDKKIIDNFGLLATNLPIPFSVHETSPFAQAL